VCVCVLTNVYACDIRDVTFDHTSCATRKADKSVRLYALREGLSQISWLCQVLEGYAKLHKQMQRGGEGDSAADELNCTQNLCLG
jgi:hypothetical protein